MRKVPYTQLCQNALWVNHFSRSCITRLELQKVTWNLSFTWPVRQYCRETVFQLTSCFTENCLKTYAGPTRSVPYTQLSERTLRENNLLTRILFHWVRIVWKPMRGLCRNCLYLTLSNYTSGKPSFNQHAHNEWTTQKPTRISHIPQYTHNTKIVMKIHHTQPHVPYTQDTYNTHAHPADTHLAHRISHIHTRYTPTSHVHTWHTPHIHHTLTTHMPQTYPTQITHASHTHVYNPPTLPHWTHIQHTISKQHLVHHTQFTYMPHTLNVHHREGKCHLLYT